MSNAWKGGSTSAWRRIRALVLQRDNYQCQIRIPATCTTTATQVHHTKGRAVTGDDPRHLVAACRPCNLKIGDPTRNQPQHKRISRW